MLQPKLIIMREQLLLYLGIEAKTRSQIYPCQSQCTHTQNKGSQTECLCQLRAESGV